jgi:hypothetical protein
LKRFTRREFAKTIDAAGAVAGTGLDPFRKIRAPALIY